MGHDYVKEYYVNNILLKNNYWNKYFFLTFQSFIEVYNKYFLIQFWNNYEVSVWIFKKIFGFKSFHNIHLQYIIFVNNNWIIMVR
jgi:hypothetical protein